MFGFMAIMKLSERSNPLVFLPMCADIVHVGHVKIMDTASQLGDVMVLLMTDEGMQTYKRNAVMPYEQRKELVLAFRAISFVMPCGGPDCYEALVQMHKPDFFIHGNDWQVGPQANARARVLDAVTSYGGKVIETEYCPGISSSRMQDAVRASLDSQTKLGVLLRTALNDLKRTPEIVGKELGIPVTMIDAVVHGQDFDRDHAWKIINLITDFYAVDKKHLSLNIDSSNGGVWHCTRQQSIDSARIFDRCNADGVSVPYYRYMDTAMASVAPFKPELIEMLVQVGDNDAMNTNVVMNKGHLLAQMTFFIGPVNFYCTIRGKRQCVAMNTGDSCIITPFVPHSFTTRDSSQYSAIIAVTFSTRVRDALPDLVLQNTQKLLAAAGDARDPGACRELRIRRAAELRGMSMQDVERLLSADHRQAEQDAILSRCLNVPQALLTVQEVKVDQEVQYAFSSKSPGDGQGRNERKPLASAMHMPDCGGFEWYVKERDTMQSQFFNYFYNHGKIPVSVEIEEDGVIQERVFAPGDSFVLKPFVDIKVAPDLHNSTETAKIVVVKVAGCVGVHALNEISTFAAEGRDNMSSNVTKWW